MTKNELGSLVRQWIDGNRKDVAEAALRLNYEDLFALVLALRKHAGAGEPGILARLMEIMK